MIVMWYKIINSIEAAYKQALHSYLFLYQELKEEYSVSIIYISFPYSHTSRVYVSDFIFFKQTFFR